MGIKRLAKLLVSLNLVLLSGCLYSVETIDVDAVSARTVLKDYGLVACLIDINSDNLLAEDLRYSKRSFSVVGKGNYKILQNESTLETITDPYSKTITYILEESKNWVGYMKNGAVSKSVGCFTVYHSQAFDDFIKKYDSLILPKDI